MNRRQVTEDGCWLYTGFITPAGYGAFSYNGRRGMLVHRAAYIELVGPIPPDLTLDHRCHTEHPDCTGGPSCQHRRCFNPDHLEPMVGELNSALSWPARKSHCKRGHPLVEPNLMPWGLRLGRRACRTCAQEAARRQQAQIREARRAG